mgnify:CR=1 FL=1
MKEEKELPRYKEIENSITSAFRKKIWLKFVEGINEFKMIEDGDKIAVCISGGKDSFLLAKCIEELKTGNIEFAKANISY